MRCDQWNKFAGKCINICESHMIIGFNNLLYLHVRGKITIFSHYITKLYRSAVVRYLHFPIITKWLLVLTNATRHSLIILCQCIIKQHVANYTTVSLTDLIISRTGKGWLMVLEVHVWSMWGDIIECKVSLPGCVQQCYIPARIITEFHCVVCNLVVYKNIACSCAQKYWQLFYYFSRKLQRHGFKNLFYCVMTSRLPARWA